MQFIQSDQHSSSFKSLMWKNCVSWWWNRIYSYLDFIVWCAVMFCKMFLQLLLHLYVVELCLVAGEATLCYYEFIKVLFSVFWVWSLSVAVHAPLLHCLSLRFRETWSGFPSGTCATKCWNVLVSAHSSPYRTFIHWWVPIWGMFLPLAPLSLHTILLHSAIFVSTLNNPLVTEI